MYSAKQFTKTYVYIFILSSTSNRKRIYPPKELSTVKIRKPTIEIGFASCGAAWTMTRRLM